MRGGWSSLTPPPRRKRRSRRRRHRISLSLFQLPPLRPHLLKVYFRYTCSCGRRRRKSGRRGGTEEKREEEEEVRDMEWVPGQW